MNDSIHNTPPYNLEAEMAVLGAMLLGDREAIERAADVVTRDDFYRDAHSHIFGAMMTINGRSEPVDIVTLNEELSRLGILEAIGGVSYVMQLGDIQFTTANIVHYAKIVQEKAICRRLIIATEAIRQRAFSQDSGSATEQLAQAEQSIFNCAGSKLTSATARWQSIGELFPKVWQDIDERYQAGKGAIPGLSTGLKSVDLITKGLRRGALITLAARTAMGKTAFATGIAAAVAKTGNAVGMFSCEMPAGDLLQRIWAAESRVPFNKLQSGDFTGAERQRVMDAQEMLYSKPLFIEDESQISITALASRARRMHAKQPLSLIVVDYLQYLDGVEGRKYPSEREKIIDITKGLKQIARDLNVPVLALSQVSRGTERRENKRPLLADLAESGRIEAESDMVIFLYRPAYYDSAEVNNDHVEAQRPDDVAPEEVEFIVAKNRNGQTGYVKLGFEPKLMRFCDLASDTGF